MKKFITNVLPYLLMAAMLVSLFPAVVLRVKNERGNKNVVVSLLYNDLRNKVSDKVLEQELKSYLASGITTVSVTEEDVNAMVARGDITCIKYNVLCHKYDDESMNMAAQIHDKYPEVSYDSYLLITKKEAIKDKLDRLIPQKYTSKEYVKLEGLTGAWGYAFYNGRTEMWDMTLGYDEEVLQKLSDMGYDLALVYKVKNYQTQGYVEYIRSLVRRYHVGYFNIKAAPRIYSEKETLGVNYTWIAPMINEENMTLVVTENADQLSNQKTLGYDEIFKDVMKKGGSQRVMRSFETYDDSQKDASLYLYRANQYFHATVDRNIRFITVTQEAPIELTYEEGADYTKRAAEHYMESIRQLGFHINGKTAPMNYSANRRTIAACSFVLIIMMLLLMWEMLVGKKLLALTVVSLLVAFVGALSNAILPIHILRLYPSIYSFVLSCFAMTVLLSLLRARQKKGKMSFEMLFALLVFLGGLCIGLLAMAAMLSGAEYYINNELFRGIKISLVIPLLYTAVAYYAIFMKEKRDIATLFNKIKLAMQTQIKVYWVVLALFFGALGMYYLRRSGNVNSISMLESALRTSITQLFPARPRIKELLIGYPSLVLLIFYIRNTDYKLLQWVFAVGTSVLASSVVNTACHVFTDLSVIYGRIFNGLFIGILLCMFVYVANLALMRIIRLVFKSLG